MINPFIIYWDINPLTCDDEIVTRICDELIDAKIFVLNVRDVSSPLSINTVRILKRLYGKPIKINLTVSNSLFGQSDVNVLQNLHPSQWYIEFRDIKDMRSSLPKITDSLRLGHSAGVSFYLTDNNFRELPAVISLCVDNNIRELNLPIQRADEGRIFFPGPEAASLLGEEIRRIPLADLKLTIHDPFMWKLIFSKDNPNEEGCNGAKTMMFIAGNYDVTPCPILSFSMGSLRSLSLKDIFSSETRLKIREELTSSPKDCESCPAVGKCVGGCRGRTYALFEGFNKKDPACHINI
ncbi:MAG: SPASM domain-containing protein [Nitrospirae bacterium]|nr:SPASM domain-containing protein [Nitrospirota bacterium]